MGTLPGAGGHWLLRVHSEYYALFTVHLRWYCHGSSSFQNASAPKSAADQNTQDRASCRTKESDKIFFRPHHRYITHTTASGRFKVWFGAAARCVGRRGQKSRKHSTQYALPRQRKVLQESQQEKSTVKYEFVVRFPQERPFSLR